MRRLVGRGVGVADGIRIIAPVGVLAVAVLAEMTPLPFAASDVVLDEHPVAFPETLAPCELAAGLGDRADILLSHDPPPAPPRPPVDLPLGPPNARHFPLPHRRRL